MTTERVKTTIPTNGWAKPLYVVVLVFTMMVAACGEITLSISSDNPPTFRFHKGSGSEVDSFPFFMVEEVNPINQNRPFLKEQREKNVVLWKIVPKRELWGTPILDRLPAITYGKVPDGFLQEVPNDGSASSLTEGKIYEASGAPTLMPGAVVRFKIENGKVTTLSLPQ